MDLAKAAGGRHFSGDYHSILKNGTCKRCVQKTLASRGSPK